MKKEKLFLKILPTVRNNLVKIKKYKRKLFYYYFPVSTGFNVHNGMGTGHAID